MSTVEQEQVVTESKSSQEEVVNHQPLEDENGFMQDVDLDAIKQPIESQEANHSVKKIVKEKKKYRFDLAVQRNSVWKLEKKSLLIHSILEGYPIPFAYAKDSNDGFFWLLDGKQRITTLINFVENNFSLDEETPLVFEKVDISGKYFKQLPKSFQEVILDAKIKILMLKNLDENQVYEMFHRLNNGEPLKPIELTRALLKKTTENIQKVANTSFFTDLIGLSATAKNRFADEEVIMQSAMTIHNYDSELSTKGIRNFMVYGDKEVADLAVNKLLSVTPFMEEAFAKVDEKLRKKILKKVNIPMLMYVSSLVVEYNNLDDTSKKVTPQEFQEWATLFFITDNKTNKNARAYAGSAASSTAKRENVRRRTMYLAKDFSETFNIEFFHKKVAEIRESIEKPKQQQEQQEQQEEQQQQEQQ